MLLANSINNANNGVYSYVFNRHDKTHKREPKEIGFSSVRGGNIVGEHQVLFFSENETIEIKHTAYSRTIFAEGALKAAEFLIKQNPRLVQYGAVNLKVARWGLSPSRHFCQNKFTIFKAFLSLICSNINVHVSKFSTAVPCSCTSISAFNLVSSVSTFSNSSCSI